MERSTLSRRRHQSASSVRGGHTRKNEGNHSSDVEKSSNHPYHGSKYYSYTLFFALAVIMYLVVMVYLFLNLPGVHNSPTLANYLEPSRDSNITATSTKVDFTYGTILAGLNSPGAYTQLESMLEHKLHPLVHPEDSVDGMKICIITHEYYGIGPSGGIGHVLYELTRLLSEHNAIVTIVYLGEHRFDDKIVRDYAVRGISIVRAPNPKIKIQPNHITLRGSYKALHFLVESEAKNEIFDIIHFNDYLGHALFPLYAKKQGWLLASSRVVITLHGTGSWTRLANGMTLPHNLDDLRQDWCEMQAISLADYVWAPSKFMATYVLSRGTKIGGKLFHIGNAPSGQSGNATNHDKATNTKTNTISEIVFFGRVEYQKGLDLFVKGLDLFASGNPGVLESMKITFLGSMTNSVRRTVNQAQSSSKNLAGIVFNFISSFDRDQTMAYVQHPTRLIVIPSLTENFPGTVFECIEVGASFIASDVGGIPEMIHPRDRNATLFRPLPKDLAQRLTDRIVKNLSNFHYTRHAVLPAQIESDILSFHNLVYTDLQGDVKPTKSMSHRPKVTVCITHYERPLVLLESLKRIQRQTYSNFDVIVVDDGSESTETMRVLEEIVAPFMHRNGWDLLIANHAYLGAARNRCARNTKNNTDYIFFIDEDDAIAQEALQVLVDTAQHARADIVTSFFNYFKGENPVTGKSTMILMFSGGSPTMGVLSNVFGGSLLLISRGAFFDLGGFTEFEEVGHEDYELHMKAALKGLRSEVIPRDDLFFIQQKQHSMSATMDLHLAFFRSMSPLLNAYPGFQDVFMLVKGLDDEIERLMMNISRDKISSQRRQLPGAKH